MAGSGDTILVVDAGTTSTRALAFAPDGAVLASARRDVTQYYPRPGWVEHDAGEIWALTLGAVREVAALLGGAERIAAIGITNQRETVVAWDKTSGEPLARAIVWQDRRTSDMCAALREAGHEADVQARTGLLLDPYFSATKMRWLLDHDEAIQASAASGRLALGTVESWLVFKLTGGMHISDASNASRTSLLPLVGTSWDAGLCNLFGVSHAALAEVVDTHGELAATAPEILGAPVPITGMAGDQQAATIGQGCLTTGQTKATYGTGAFVLTNMGSSPPLSRHRLLATVLSQSEGERSYALEGSIFVAGSLIQWLRDSLGVIRTAEETEALARSVADSAGVVIVPALSGLGAPHWRPEALGAISGLSFAAGRAHLARAALEAMAHQTHDLAAAFAADGAGWTSLAIDGGMSANDWMVQDIADITGLPVERPTMVESTALGAAMLAGTGCGMFATLEEASTAMRGGVTRFAPSMREDERDMRLAAWCEALAKI
jgi:glycerol kinase